MKLSIFGLKAIGREKLFQMPIAVFASQTDALEKMFDYFEKHDPSYYETLTTKSIWSQICDGQYSYIDGATNTFRSMLYIDGEYVGAATFIQSKEFWKLRVSAASHRAGKTLLEQYLLASKFKKSSRDTYTLIKRL